ncbi:50S ribosomal protein L24 [Patescibacteria group bacterium]|nr:50S ribosomal protein L24 [Patescibacteria group bacterium]
MKIHKNDKVKVLIGKYKGVISTVSKVLGSKNMLFVKDVNIAIKHVKAQKGIEGGRVKIEKPIAQNKVMLICPKCEKPTRVGIKIVDNRKKRFCKKCKEII